MALGLVATFVACDNNEPAKSGDNIVQSGENQNENENNNQEVRINTNINYTIRTNIIIV